MVGDAATYLRVVLSVSVLAVGHHGRDFDTLVHNFSQLYTSKILSIFVFGKEACTFLREFREVLILFIYYLRKKIKIMKVSQNNKHLGESIALGAVLVATSVGIFVVMMMQSGVLQ